MSGRIPHPLDHGGALAWAAAWGVDGVGYGLFADVVVGSFTYRMRWLPPGRFLMGSPESEEGRFGDEPLHEVDLASGFWIGETTVTQALWREVTGENPSRYHENGEERPVDSVSADDIKDRFLPALEERVPGLALRLPSEEEWEYACRAGTRTAYAFGDSITSEQVAFERSDDEGTVPVHSLPANRRGLYEMHGNVWEWTSSVYEADPEDRIRVLRGGSFAGAAQFCRSASRYWFPPGVRWRNFGFRLARGSGPEAGRTGGPGSAERSGRAAEPPGLGRARARGQSNS